jgi:serine/threonine-protein kinase
MAQPDAESTSPADNTDKKEEFERTIEVGSESETEETVLPPTLEDEGLQQLAEEVSDSYGRIKASMVRTDPMPVPGVEPEPKVITNDIADPEEPKAGKIDTGPSDATGRIADGKTSGLKPLSEGVLLNGRYEIIKKIGGGGMGAVYVAADHNLGGVQRAVKEMVQSSIEEEQQKKAVDDFKRESMILTTLDHPSIPTIFDYFFDESEGRFYLVMKYISGGDLAGRLRAAPEGRIDEKTVTGWALQITDVLTYLHTLPTTIVYRDLKPSNVMIDGRSGRIMLIDFGIARSINQQREKGVTAVGTMGYAPPELFSGNVEPRSDIYSLGSTMFHLLTGADPQNNPLLIFDFQKNPRPRQINPQLSDQMERILMRAVEYNADARFESSEEMKQVLTDHLENLNKGTVTYGVTKIPTAVSLANQNVFCGFCGQRIVATDLFCAFCGAKQPIAQHGVHSEIYSRTVPTARLIVDGTSELQAPVFSLEKNDNLLGRRDPMSNIFPEIDLSRFDPQTKISRRHARIWSDGPTFLVEDLGSSNGTVLLPGTHDSIRLEPHQPHPISNGDRLRVGDTTLHFLVG